MDRTNQTGRCFWLRRKLVGFEIEPEGFLYAIRIGSGVTEFACLLIVIVIDGNQNYAGVGQIVGINRNLNNICEVEVFIPRVHFAR